MLHCISNISVTCSINFPSILTIFHFSRAFSGLFHITNIFTHRFNPYFVIYLLFFVDFFLFDWNLTLIYWDRFYNRLDHFHHFSFFFTRLPSCRPQFYLYLFILYFTPAHTTSFHMQCTLICTCVIVFNVIYVISENFTCIKAQFSDIHFMPRFLSLTLPTADPCLNSSHSGICMLYI